MKICFIEQSCGLGDILLSIKIGRHFVNAGHEVIWPIENTYKYFSDYISIPGIDFVDIKTEFDHKEKYLKFVSDRYKEVLETKDYIHVPVKNSFHSKEGQTILQSTRFHDLANMHGKFAMCSLTPDDWQDYFEIKRNFEKEEELFSILNPQRAYHLVNKNFGTPPRWHEVLEKNILTPYPLVRVEMKMIPKFTAFDWLKVFEKSDKIDTVSTSTFYLFEKIDLQCTPTIYSRNTSFRSYQENFGWLHKLSRKNYLFIS